MADPAAILIDRADIPSLAAIAIAPEPHRLALLAAVGPDHASSRRREVVLQHATITSGDPPLDPDLVLPGLPGQGLPADLPLACELISAATIAMQMGIPRIVDPRQVGPDARLVGEGVDLAIAVIQLCRAAGASPPLIDMPLLDLTDRQIVELADDGGAPLHLAWPCSEAGVVPCGTCSECTRWTTAFDEADVPRPWAASAST